ncbi:dihydrofolate reductase family protein, partial [Streptomyces sp. NPDC057757]|uniref:dihydrofolate reductase family protein n=1 Tax=Streptomyces sp. NPDC057757 TaxID=3346241 RepID=UPI00367E87D5
LLTAADPTPPTLGRRHWPKQTDPADPVAAKLNSLPKYVPSSTLTRPEWAGTTVIDGDLGKEVSSLKERTEGELQIHGSGALARSLFALGLIDTVHMLTFPVVLGAGRRLFAEGATPAAFRHAGGSITSTGVAINTYELAGSPTYGSY